MMRTTLDIDEDVLSAVKDLATAEHTTAGKVISDLARKALTPPAGRKVPKMRNGFSLFQFPRKGKGLVVTMEMINKLRDESE